MKKFLKITAAVLTGALLSLSATTAFADGRGHDRHRYEGRGWEHRHHHHHRGPVVYAPVRHYAPAPVYYGPPRVVYQPDYYVPRAAPAISIGLSPIVIPLR
jgi:hypothetical protein